MCRLITMSRGVMFYKGLCCKDCKVAGFKKKTLTSEVGVYLWFCSFSIKKKNKKTEEKPPRKNRLESDIHPLFLKTSYSIQGYRVDRAHLSNGGEEAGHILNRLLVLKHTKSWLPITSLNHQLTQHACLWTAPLILIHF